MPPVELGSLDAMHLASARQRQGDIGRIVTYDERMATAARTLGFAVVAPF
jgi:predicted nucleic acid-binding protein